MADFYGDVGAFRSKFGFQTEADGPPRLLPEIEFEIQFNHMLEELVEIREAHEAGDLAGVADGLVDLVYVALGTAQLMRLPFNELWDEVQRANMAKRRARDASESKRGDPNDVVKPEGWEGPDIEGVLARALRRHWGGES